MGEPIRLLDLLAMGLSEWLVTRGISKLYLHLMLFFAHFLPETNVIPRFFGPFRDLFYPVVNH